MPLLLVDFIRVAFKIYSLLIIVRVLMSWFQPDPRNPFVRGIASLTDPVLEPLRRIIPSIGGLDLSPIAALFLIQLLERLVLRLLS